MILPLLALASALAPHADEFEHAPGYTVAPAASERASFLALCVAPDGRVILATERRGLLVAGDDDGDGAYEHVAPLCEDLVGVQGLAVVADELFAAGRRASDGAGGLWRLPLTGGTPALVLPIEGDDEHGAHAVIPDGEGGLLLAIGDSASITTPPAAPLPEPKWTPDLPPLDDPSGFGQRQRRPWGHVARVDPGTGAWSVHSFGYRNHYDLVRLDDGTLFTVDSDMEWDVGLPWYRPVRVLECRAGEDYGSRPGSAARPMHLEPPPVATLGRGSPTGLVRLPEARWPERDRGALVVGDWSNGTLVAVDLARLELEEDGERRWIGAGRTLLRAKGALPVTDLALDAHGLLFTTGGRGAPGRLWRLRWGGGPGPPRTAVPRPDAAARADLETVRARYDEVAAAARETVEGDAARLDDLLTRLETGARTEALHVANVLRTLEVDWTDARRARLLAFFEEASTWSGGGNLQGYVGAMLREVLARLDGTAVARLAEAGALGPRALATLVAERPAEETAGLVAPLRTAFADLDEGDDAALTLQRKRALVRALAGALEGARVEGLAAWLRVVYEDEPRLREDVLQRLAEQPAEEDRARLVAGLGSGRHEVREACARALLALPPMADADAARLALDQARRRGERGGAWPFAALVHASGGAIAGGGDWETRLAEAERWFARTFPDWRPPRRGPEDGPGWEFDALVAFVEVAAPGDAARGAEAYARLTCATCHTFGALGGGWGPDLVGVTRRFDARTLVRSIVEPSETIAERYALTELSTVDGERVEGRVVRETADALEMLLSSGARVEVSRDEVASRALSPLSAMPEGLLEGVPLEDVRDLVAFLSADGVAGSAGEAPRWRAMFDDAERRRWGGSFAGWILDRGVLVGSGDGSVVEPLTFDAAVAELALEFDVLAEGGAARVRHGTHILELDDETWRLGARRGALPAPRNAAGWRHVRLDVRGGTATLEVDGLRLATIEIEPRAANVELLRPAASDARVWLAHLRMLR